MKGMGLILVLLACSGTGLLMSSGIRARIRQLTLLREAAVFIREEIRYRLCPVEDIMLALSRTPRYAPLGFWDALCAAERDGDSRDPARLAAIVRAAPGLKLTTEERAGFCDFYLGLGAGDMEAQQSWCNLYIERMGEAAGALKTDGDKRIKLYNTLGVLAGMFLCVIMM